MPLPPSSRCARRKQQYVHVFVLLLLVGVRVVCGLYITHSGSSHTTVIMQSSDILCERTKCAGEI
jgi:hypothetical protein